jgi:hypothetical protein
VDVASHQVRKAARRYPTVLFHRDFPSTEGNQTLGRASWREDIDDCLRVGAVMLPHVDEAISCPAEVTSVVEAEAVEHAAAVPAMVCRFDAAIVRLPVAYPALQRHVLRGRRLAFNRSPEGMVKVFGQALSSFRSAPTIYPQNARMLAKVADYELEILG